MDLKENNFFWRFRNYYNNYILVYGWEKRLHLASYFANQVASIWRRNLALLGGLGFWSAGAQSELQFLQAIDGCSILRGSRRLRAGGPAVRPVCHSGNAGLEAASTSVPPAVSRCRGVPLVYRDGRMVQSERKEIG